MILEQQKTMIDGTLATGMSTAPAWAPWLADFNQVLTTLTLIAGLALGIARLVATLRERRLARLANKGKHHA